MKILVTGAASPLGRIVVQLLRSRGHRVAGLARRLSGIKLLEKLGAEAFRGDVRRPDHVARAIVDCDAVIHLAGFFDFWEPTPGTYDSVNVGGVRQVLAGAKAAGARRVVLCSSAITIGESSGSLGDESTSHRGHTITRLEKSKLEAERLALKARARGLEVVVVNPGVVVAPGDPGWLGRLIGATVRGRRPLAAHAPIGWVWVEDAANGIVRAVEQGDDGARYILCGDTFSSHKLLSRIAATAHSRGPRAMPSHLVLAEAALRTAMAKPLGKRPSVAFDEAKFLTTGFEVRGTRARDELEVEYTPASRWLPMVARAYQLRPPPMRGA
jgi:nucleoside-diphosphate-sugar epimerase